MKRKQFLNAVLLLFIITFTACGENTSKKAVDAKKQTYTCPMHPQIVQEKPGTCPICGMDLVLFDRSNQDPSLTLHESQQELANISTITIGSSSLSNTKQLNGRLVTDPDQTAIISSRVPGRIEVLYIKETGVPVRIGQPLYKIYSEQLASLQQEYLIAVAQAKQFPDDEKFKQIENAARQKLVLYDQSNAQISKLLKDQHISPYVTYSANLSGTVSALSVGEGQYVSEGADIMRIENYDRLWVEADLYPAEADAVRVGDAVQVIISGWEHQPQQMKVQFISPSLQNDAQLMQVRGTIANINQQWQAGLQASILLPQKSKTTVLSIPVDAVIRDEKGSLVWMETGRGKFEPRMVKTGIEDADQVEIIEGLKQGDKVVVTGVYLLNSEYILKKGADPMAGHSH